MRLTIEHSLTAAPSQMLPSPRALELAAMFGVGVDEEQTTPIIPRCEIPLPDHGGIVFINGPSGSGKSTLLKLIARQCVDRGIAVMNLDRLAPARDVPLIDGLGDSLERSVSLLSQAGLGDAFVMLRTPSQLSDGQRARLRIAQAMEWAETESQPCGHAMHAQYGDGMNTPRVIIADEFAATLDRLTAQTLACSIRRWIDRTRQVFIAATTHDDLLEALDPDVLVFKGLGDQIEVSAR